MKRQDRKDALARKEEILSERSNAWFDPITDQQLRAKFNIHLKG